MKLRGVKGLQKGVTMPSVSMQAIEVLRLLNTFGWQPSLIAKHLKKSRKNVYKHFKVLSEKGFFEKFKGVTRKGYTLLGCTLKPNKFFRINGVQVYFELPLSVDKGKWKRFVGRVLFGKKVSFAELPVLKNRGGVTDRPLRFWVFDKFDARVHANGVMVYFPDIFGESGSDAELNLIKGIQIVGKELNRIFGVVFFDENNLRIRLLKYELAHLDDSVAKEFRRGDRKLSVSIDGVKRVIVDFSFKVDELETVSVSHGLEDQDVLQLFFKDVLKLGKGVLVPSDALELFKLQAGVNENKALELKELSRVVLEQGKLNFLLSENLKDIVRVQGEILEKLG